jgi:transcription elongation factor GreB
MSRMRTRPDESGKPGYITAEGYRRLEEEAGRLWTVERPKLVKSVATAAAEGDRSENAEYIYGKKKLAEIDRRLQFLGKRLEVLKIVDEPPERDGRVYFGAWVTLEDEDGQRSCYQIVGSDEVMIPPPTSPRPGPERKRISMDSPLAKALLRKCIGDEITVQRPKGEITYEIIEVTYGSGAL